MKHIIKAKPLIEHLLAGFSEGKMGLKPNWLAALQPCGKRLVVALPAWVPACEQDLRRLDGAVRRSLLSASATTLDLLL